MDDISDGGVNVCMTNSCNCMQVAGLSWFLCLELSISQETLHGKKQRSST